MKIVKLFVDTIWANFIINDNNVPEDTKAGQIRTITITIEFCFLHKQAQKINIICQITLNFRDLANYSLFLIKKEPKSVYIIKIFIFTFAIPCSYNHFETDIALYYFDPFYK